MRDGMTREQVVEYLKDWDTQTFPLLFTMWPTVEQLDLLVKYREPIAAFRDFMREVYAHPDDDEEYNWEEVDFRGVCIGYLAARGVPHTDAHGLDTFLRYNLQYFDVDPDVNPNRAR